MRAVALLLGVLISGVAIADDWKTEIVSDGNVVVNSKVYSEKNDEGKKRQILEYNAEVVSDAAYEDVINTLLDVSKHKDFLDGTEESKVLEVNGDKTLAYYFFGAPWPMPDADCVVDITYTKGDSVFEMYVVANPAGAELGKVKRMSLYDAKYTVVKGDSGSTIKYEVKLSPAAKAPAFLVKTWFPKGPAGIVNGIASLSK